MSVAATCACKQISRYFSVVNVGSSTCLHGMCTTTTAFDTGNRGYVRVSAQQALDKWIVLQAEPGLQEDEDGEAYHHIRVGREG